VNSGPEVEIGVVRSYQAGSTIDWSTLDAARQYRFETQDGRRLSVWAAALSTLRKLVHSAMESRQPDQFLQVCALVLLFGLVFAPDTLSYVVYV
jgi:hypothetical protein